MTFSKRRAIFVEQLRLIYITSVRTLDAVKNTYKEGYMIGMDSKKDSGNFMVSVRLDDDVVGDNCDDVFF